jgi:hypothetical protein
MSNKSIVIIHFLPIELFPPALNFINAASKKKEFQGEITVFSTKKAHSQFQYFNKNVRLIRPYEISLNNIKLIKLMKYVVIYGRITLYLLIKRPKTVVYYETFSALPVILYFYLSRQSRKPLIYIHCHELVTLIELSKGRWFYKNINRLEQKIYNHAKWISHTNNKRLDIFSEQYGLDKKNEKLNILPNYPPSLWIKRTKYNEENKKNKIIKLVHIGALSIKGMYFENVLEWFGNKPEFTIDFYSHNFTNEIKALISSYGNCSINGSIAYNDIPSLKGFYDVGLVLYNGVSLNFTYNAPNKIFEYLALDLDVWCSNKLITSSDYVRLDCYPKMIMVDYENLEAFDVDKALDTSGLEYVPSPYVCEPVYEKFLSAINENSNT